jgi:hypothetical protein
VPRTSALALYRPSSSVDSAVAGTSAAATAAASAASAFLDAMPESRDLFDMAAMVASSASAGRITVRSFDGVQFALAPRWATVALLRCLFAMADEDEPVLVHPETLAVRPGRASAAPHRRAPAADVPDDGTCCAKVAVADGDGSLASSVAAGQVYQVLPRWLVDTSDSEPEEYRAPPSGVQRVVAPERLAAVRAGAQRVAATYHTRVHPAFYGPFDPVR